jgi:hypothetical protein
LQRARPELALREIAYGLHKTALLIGQAHKHAATPRMLTTALLAAIAGPSSNAFLLSRDEAIVAAQIDQ